MMKPVFAFLAIATIFATGSSFAGAQTPAPNPPAPTDPAAPPAPVTPPSTTSTPPPPAPDTSDSKGRFVLGPEIGIYIPTDARTRAAFGDTWVDYGIGFRPIQLVTRHGAAGLDFNIISTDGTGRKAFLIPVTLIYKQAFGSSDEPGKGLTPYFGVSAGLLLADLRSDNYNVHSGFRAGYGGTALIGVTYKQKAYLEARYEEFSKIKGFDLSGLNIATGFRF